MGLYKRYRFFQEAKKYSKFYLTETSVKRSRVGNLWSWKLHYQNWEINLEVQVVYIIYFLSLCDFQYFLLIYFWYLSDLAKFNYSKFKQILVLRPAKDNLLDLELRSKDFIPPWWGFSNKKYVLNGVKYLSTAQNYDC